MAVLACRPLAEIGAKRPQPRYLPDDVTLLAEALLMRGGTRGERERKCLGVEMGAVAHCDEDDDVLAWTIGVLPAAWCARPRIAQAACCWKEDNDP